MKTNPALSAMPLAMLAETARITYLLQADPENCDALSIIGEPRGFLIDHQWWERGSGSADTITAAHPSLAGAIKQAYEVMQGRFEREIGKSEPTLADLIAEITAWQHETFPDATLSSITAHLIEETDELERGGNLRDEIADCLFLMFALGARLDNLIAAEGLDMKTILAEKFEINKAAKFELTEKGYAKRVKEVK